MQKMPDHCGGYIKRLNELMEKNANNELMAEGVTFSQMKMLGVLENTRDGSATLKELERYFNLTQATIAGTAVRLKKKGLVDGYSDIDDRRVKHIRITKKGHELCLRTKAYMEQAEEKLLHSLDEKERAEFIRLLKKVYESIK